MELHHRTATVLAAGILVLASAAHAQEQHRQLGPHLHGHGTLAIAVEDNTIQMELVAPGMDIVGFEHEPDTSRQRRAVEAALADLGQPLTLFAMPDSAGCTVTFADVKIVTDEDEHSHDDGHSHGDGGDGHSHGDGHGHDHGNAQAAGAEDPDHEGRHAEFRATYTLACTDAAQVRSINFHFFDRFRDSSTLEVTFIDASGQTSFAVSRESRYMEN